MRLSVYTDGGSRGNPGVSGFGVVIYDDQRQILTKISQYIGIKTNNEAEYSALISALTWIEANRDKFDVTAVNFYADSQLMIRQLQGVYKVKAENILPLYQSAQVILHRLKLDFNFYDILRDKNALADELANEAMDKKL